MSPRPQARHYRRGVMPAGSEDAFAQAVQQFARYHGWLHYHTHRSDRSVPGFPDEVMVRGPRLVFAELKREDAPPRIKVADRPRVLAERPVWLHDLSITEPQAEWLMALRGVVDALNAWLPEPDDPAREPDPHVPAIPSIEVYVWTPVDWPDIEHVLGRAV